MEVWVVWVTGVLLFILTDTAGSENHQHAGWSERIGLRLKQTYLCVEVLTLALFLPFTLTCETNGVIEFGFACCLNSSARCHKIVSFGNMDRRFKSDNRINIAFRFINAGWVTLFCWCIVVNGTGCTASKLYDDQWPPRRMHSPDGEYKAMGGLRSGESKTTFLQTERAAEIESHLNSQ